MKRRGSHPQRAAHRPTEALSIEHTNLVSRLSRRPRGAPVAPVGWLAAPSPGNSRSRSALAWRRCRAPAHHCSWRSCWPSRAHRSAGKPGHRRVVVQRLRFPHQTTPFRGRPAQSRFGCRCGRAAALGLRLQVCPQVAELVPNSASVELVNRGPSLLAQAP